MYTGLDLGPRHCVINQPEVYAGVSSSRTEQFPGAEDYYLHVVGMPHELWASSVLDIQAHERQT